MRYYYGNVHSTQQAQVAQVQTCLSSLCSVAQAQTLTHLFRLVRDSRAHVISVGLLDINNREPFQSFNSIKKVLSLCGSLMVHTDSYALTTYVT